jgi:hypothetical protein
MLGWRQLERRPNLSITYFSELILFGLRTIVDSSRTIRRGVDVQVGLLVSQGPGSALPRRTNLRTELRAANEEEQQYFCGERFFTVPFRERVRVT